MPAFVVLTVYWPRRVVARPRSYVKLGCSVAVPHVIFQVLHSGLALVDEHGRPAPALPGLGSVVSVRDLLGAINSTVVTLSNIAEATAVMSTSSTITRNGEPLARFAAQMATYSNTPVRRRIPTMIIML